MMRINIDLRQSNWGGGISNYIKNISLRLLCDSKYTFTGCNFFARNRNSSEYDWYPNQVKTGFLPENFIFNVNHELPLNYEFILRSKSDLNVFFSYRLPHVRFKSPVVSTIHDILVLKTQLESEEFIKSHLKTLQHTISHSKYILTVSESSKKDLVEYFNIDPEKIFVVHNGIDQNLFSNPISDFKLSMIKKIYNLPQTFILYFGEYRKHKNIERLILAYVGLDIKTKEKVKLVFTKFSNEINNLAEKYNIVNNITYLGWVPEQDKVAIFKLANIVYYASLYEGFGVPIIEAQAAGTPVITSNLSSLPEAAGINGAAFVNPYSIEDIRQAIVKILDDSNYRDLLIQNGKLNSSLYNWNRSTNEFYNFLSSIGI